MVALRKEASSVPFWGPRVVVFAEGRAAGGACWAAHRHGASPATRSVRVSPSMITSDRLDECSRFFSPSCFASGFVIGAAKNKELGERSTSAFLQGPRSLMFDFTALLQFREGTGTTDAKSAATILMDSKIRAPARCDQLLRPSSALLLPSLWNFRPNVSVPP